jgi:hypothetical protein
VGSYDPLEEMATFAGSINYGFMLMGCTVQARPSPKKHSLPPMIYSNCWKKYDDFPHLPGKGKKGTNEHAPIPFCWTLPGAIK